MRQGILPVHLGFADNVPFTYGTQIIDLRLRVPVRQTLHPPDDPGLCELALGRVECWRSGGWAKWAALCR